VPVSAVLGYLAAEITADQITAEYPAVCVAGVRAVCGTALASEGVRIVVGEAASSRRRDAPSATWLAAIPSDWHLHAG